MISLPSPIGISRRFLNGCYLIDYALSQSLSVRSTVPITISLILDDIPSSFVILPPRRLQDTPIVAGRPAWFGFIPPCGVST
jgi:hypothetical protein